MTVDELREAVGLYARLERVRKSTAGRVPSPALKLSVFHLEQRLNALGLVFDPIQWEPPPEPEPPVQLRKAA